MVSGNYFGYEAAYPGTSNLNIMGLPTASSAASSSMTGLGLGNALDPNGKRERTKFNDRQLQILENVFVGCHYPQGIQREGLAKELGLTETKVQVWFKNRRAKDRAHKKFESLRQESLGNGAKRFGSASQNGNSNGSCNRTNLSNTGSSARRSPEYRNGILAGDDERNHLTAPFAPNGISLLQHNNNVHDAASGSAGGSVGDTEDENEGNDLRDSKVGAKFRIKNEPSASSDASDASVGLRVPHYPMSMPMIPLPTSNTLDYDLKPFDNGGSSTNCMTGMSANSMVNAAAAAAAAAMMEKSIQSNSSNGAFFPFSTANNAVNCSPSPFLPPYPNVYQNYHQQQSQTTGKPQLPSASFPAGSFDLSTMAASSFNPLAAAQGWMAPNYPSMLLHGFSNGVTTTTASNAPHQPTITSNSNSILSQSDSTAHASPTSTATAVAAAAMSNYYATPPLASATSIPMAAYDFYNSYCTPPSTAFWDSKFT